MDLELLKKLSESIIDFIWNAPKIEFPLDKSARICSQNRILFPLTQRLNTTITTEEEALKFYLNELKNDSRFRSIIFNINDTTIQNFNTHFFKYGGRTGSKVIVLYGTIEVSGLRNKRFSNRC